MKSKFLIIFVIICAVIVIVFVRHPQKAQERSSSPEIIPVKVTKVELKDINNVLEYVGNIKAEDEVLVYPKVTGKIVEKVKEEGTLVNKGEAILYVDRDEVGLKFEKAPVESPLSGVVGKIMVDIGSNINPLLAVAMVVNLDNVKIDLDLPEKYISRISMGQDALISVDAYPNQVLNGKVSKISPVLDLSTRTVQLEIIVSNPDQKLKSGMYARVKLILESRQKTPVIIKEAIIGRAPETYVFVVENKKAVLRKVRLGIQEGPLFEVIDGLKEGDQLVVMGQQRLADGLAVEPEE